MKANPKAHHFLQATFRLDREGRNIFIGRKNNLAIIPLWNEGGKMGVLVTGREKEPEALEAALAIQALISRFSETRERDKDRVLQDSLALFKKFDFKGAGETARKGL